MSWWLYWKTNITNRFFGANNMCLEKYFLFNILNYTFYSMFWKKNNLILNVFRKKKFENFSKSKNFLVENFFSKFLHHCVFYQILNIFAKKYFRKKNFFSKNCEYFFSQLSENFVVGEPNDHLFLKNILWKFQLSRL